MNAAHIHLVGVGLGNLGLVLGVVAACYWYWASRVDMTPNLPPGAPFNQQVIAAWIQAISEGAAKSGRLNAIAAALSGAAVLVSTLASFFAGYGT